MTPVLGVSAATRVYGVLGMPVRHSLSPVMQTAAFNAAGLDACYLAFEVRPEDLASALAGAASLGFSGLNVTVPHKRAAFLLAVERDASASATGAANTLVPCNGGWKAYNTDVAGFVEAVGRELSFDPSGRRAALIGAGGAARGAVHGLLSAGAAEVILAARDLAKAQTLASEFSAGQGRVLAARFADVPALLSDGDLLVSATPVGLDPDGRWPFDPAELRKGVLVFDMAYGRGRTSLEAQATDAGLKAASGRLMLVCQGAEAFRLWTGLTPPLEAMRKAFGGG